MQPSSQTESNPGTEVNGKKKARGRRKGPEPTREVFEEPDELPLSERIWKPNSKTRELDATKRNGRGRAPPI